MVKLISLKWAVLSCVCRVEGSFPPCGSLSISKQRHEWIMLYVTVVQVWWLMEQSIQASTLWHRRRDFLRWILNAQWIKSSNYANKQLGNTRGCLISLAKVGTSQNCHTSQGKKSWSAQSSEEQHPFLHLFLCICAYTHTDVHFVIEKKPWHVSVF